LRALQEREIDRIGGSKPVKVDIRIIATSNRDLAAEVSKNRFREDLLFRLNVLNLRVPPLRERPADIEVLADHFARKYADANGVPARPLSADARRELMRCPWRGNVRELENTLHRAVLLATGAELDVDSIRLPDGTRPDEGLAGAAGETAAEAARLRTLVGRTVADVERDLILDTLNHCLGNRTHAAHILGISIRTLRNKLKQYSTEGVAVPGPGDAQRAAV
jgi:DNA-binding NtrC family response regulator